MDKIIGEHKDNVFLPCSPGIASIVVFKSHASLILHIYEVESDDEVSINNVASAIVSEVKSITADKEAYNGRVDIHSRKSEVSATLSKFLSLLTLKDLYEDSLPASNSYW